ncbi:bifunctional 2-polyprenyl-6-hydroxyphenol methylase/3-demethylubiquinol 3-O-methyltransferase UbiG [bacterium]|nr:bifunctional 2-polyprenyl-6-hydroxyphenol methylase/3-demethylubiquinol 3-O-methyltransferase UbiG [bacterium]
MVKVLAHDAAPPRSASVDPAEIEKFRAMAADWWNPAGKFRPLHKFNPVRLDFIRNLAVRHFARDDAARRPLDGLRLLDVGCGGGLVAEPMARLGASVVGVDAGEANIKAASVHATEAGVDVDYRVGTVEGLIGAGEAPFDIVLTLEVVEHVVDPARFLSDCAALVKPGGILVVATLNRTPKAFALAIVGAEHVLRWLPVGTHDWSKFVTPAEARAALVGAGLRVDPPIGVSFSPLQDRWSLSRDTGVNYMLTAVREVS